jgi:nicotinamide-nucleotide amidase|tara:strand:+ start:3439 stop:3927 length:489 start_codon:yes stop_codon:yes gene_type:complete
LELNNLENLSTELGALLQKKNMFFTSAESCTGGLLSQSIVSVPGSSGWFGCSFVTYSNISKHKILGVSKDSLKRFGAVSEEVVTEMVDGAVAESRADLGVAISGIAGPGGGSPDRPVGTVCIAWKLKDKQAVRSTFLFEGNRNEVRYATVVKSLEEAIELIK